MIAGSLRPFTTRTARNASGLSHLPGEGARRDRGSDEHDRATAGHDPLMRYVDLRRHTDNGVTA